MAGSFNHLIGDDGSFSIDLIENMGDAEEALRDCWDIIDELTQEAHVYFPEHLYPWGFMPEIANLIRDLPEDRRALSPTETP